MAEELVKGAPIVEGVVTDLETGREYPLSGKTWHDRVVDIEDKGFVAYEVKVGDKTMCLLEQAEVKEVHDISQVTFYVYGELFNYKIS